MNKYFILLFLLFLFGCINENETQEEIVEEISECKINNLECFFNNIMNGTPSIVHFSSETPVINLIQRSRGYYKSKGCVNDVCSFEVYYYETDVYFTNETMDALIQQNVSEEEINSELKIIKDSLDETWGINKVICEMSKDEAKIYLQEYLDSIEGKTSSGTIGSKRCNLISK